MWGEYGQFCYISYSVEIIYFLYKFIINLGLIQNEKIRCDLLMNMFLGAIF